MSKVVRQGYLVTKVCWALVWALASVVCQAQDPQLHDGAVILTGFFDYAQSLQSATCVVESSDGNEYLFAFDRPWNRERFDVVLSDEAVIPGRRIQWARNRDGVILFTSDNGIAKKAPPDFRSKISDANPWDIRMVGPASFAEMRHKVTLEDFRKVTEEKRSLRDVVDLGDAVKLVFDERVGPNRIYERSLVIAPKRGYACTGMQLSLRGEFKASTSVELVEIDGHWLPSKCHYKTRGEHDVVHRFTWDKVNQPIPPSCFEAEGLGLTTGTLIISLHGDKSVIEHKVTNFEELKELASGKRKSWVSGQHILIGLTIAVGIAACIVAIRRNVR